MTALFISAFLLGLLFNAAPGAVFAETVRQGTRGGFRPALAVQLGSLVGDALWGLVGLAGVGVLLQLDWLRWPVGIAGSAYLLWLAHDSWIAAGREFSVNAPGMAGAQKAMRGVPGAGNRIGTGCHGSAFSISFDGKARSVWRALIQLHTASDAPSSYVGMRCAFPTYALLTCAFPFGDLNLFQTPHPVPCPAQPQLSSHARSHLSHRSTPCWSAQHELFRLWR
jgi:hypothetical protein